MKKFIGYLLRSSKITSNGVVTLLAFIMMSIGFIANLFWNYEIDKFIYESMQWIVMIGLGATASEKVSEQINFGGKKPQGGKHNNHGKHDRPSDSDNL